MLDKNDHDLLICIDAKLKAFKDTSEERWDDIKKQFNNHLATHARYTYLAIATTSGMVITLILMLLKLR